MAPDGQYCVAVWERHQVGGDSGASMYNSNLYISRVDGWEPLDISEDVAVADSSSEERNPALAGNGSGTMLAVYEKQTEGSSQIMSRLMTIGESISVGSEVTIKSDASGGTRRTNPAVAFGPASSGNPAVFMAVWQEGWHGDSSL